MKKTPLFVALAVLFCLALTILSGRSALHAAETPPAAPAYPGSDEYLQDKTFTAVTMRQYDNGADAMWQWVTPVVNDTDEALTIVQFRQLRYRGGQFAEEFPATDFWEADFTVAPHAVRPVNDGYPVTDTFDEILVIYDLRSASGAESQQIFRCRGAAETTAAAPVDYAADAGQDLLTLRHGADYAVGVYPDVEWVPVSALGESRYTNAEIHAILTAAPEEKQAQIASLYEAVQLFEIGGFYNADDNIRIEEGGIDWEHHKPGYDAVRTNNGCCAADTSWLNYLLRGDYEEIGCIAYSMADGSGHVFNYIRQGEWYYFIDLTHYRTDWMETAAETGVLDDYFAVDYVAGNLHRAKSVEAYAAYLLGSFINEAPGLVFQYTAEDCLAIDGAPTGEGVTIFYETAPGADVRVIYDDPADALTFAFAPAPVQRSDWSAEPSCSFAGQ